MSYVDKVWHWKHEICDFFGSKLLPLPNVEVSGSTKELRDFSNGLNGEVKETKISFLVSGVNRKSISVHVFLPKENSLSLQRCIFPGCTKTKHGWIKSWFSSCVFTDKRHLCSTHVKKVKTHLQKLYGENVRRDGYIAKDSNPLMLLITLMYKASLQKETFFQLTSNEDKTRMLQELFTNVQNYLIIVDLLVDINGELVAVLLSYVMDLVIIILKNTKQNHPIANFVILTSKIIEESIFFFGIMYSWESLDTNCPYGDLGAGIGGMGGVLSTITGGNAIIGLASMVVFSSIGRAAGNAYYRNRRAKQQMEKIYSRYQHFRKVHEVQTFPMTRAFVFAILIAIIAMLIVKIAVKND